MLMVNEIYLVLAIGLCVGSFIAMLCYRLPLIEQETEMIMADALANDKPLLQNPKTSINLFLPRSFCPNCKTTIAWYLNLPVLGYIFSKAKCINCRQKISAYYPIVELLSLAITLLVYFTSAINFESLLLFIALQLTLALIIIDYKHFILPIALTTILLWLGLVNSIVSTKISSSDAIIGALVGYLLLWSVYHLLRLVIAKEGMGYGDFNFLAAIGAWFGWQYLSIVLLLACIICFIYIFIVVVVSNKKLSDSYPFGVFLGISFIILHSLILYFEGFSWQQITYLL